MEFMNSCSNSLYVQLSHTYHSIREVELRPLPCIDIMNIHNLYPVIHYLKLHSSRNNTFVKPQEILLVTQHGPTPRIECYINPELIRLMEVV